MKKVSGKIIMVVALLSLWACANKTEAAKGTGKEKDGPPPCQVQPNAHNVPSDEAIKNVCNNLTFLKSVGIDCPVKGFLVSKYDLLSALGMDDSQASQFDYVRFYIGLTPDKRHKLYLTPVNNANPCSNNGGSDTLLRGPLPGSSQAITDIVLDLNYPCPNLCATNNIFDACEVKCNQTKP